MAEHGLSTKRRSFAGPDARVNGAPQALAVTAGRTDGQVIIEVGGELDLGTLELVDKAIREAEEEDCKTILVDLRKLTFIDSSGLSLLLGARRRCDRLRFVPSEHDAVARIIALTDTEEIFGFPAQRG